MVRSEGNVSLKNPVTPLGIDPGTVRLVAQRLNHYATLGPPPGHVVQSQNHKCLTLPLQLIQRYLANDEPSFLAYAGTICYNRP